MEGEDRYVSLMSCVSMKCTPRKTYSSLSDFTRATTAPGCQLSPISYAVLLHNRQLVLGCIIIIIIPKCLGLLLLEYFIYDLKFNDINVNIIWQLMAALIT